MASVRTAEPDSDSSTRDIALKASLLQQAIGHMATQENTLQSYRQTFAVIESILVAVAVASLQPYQVVTMSAAQRVTMSCIAIVGAVLAAAWSRACIHRWAAVEYWMHVVRMLENDSYRQSAERPNTPMGLVKLLHDYQDWLGTRQHLGARPARQGCLSCFLDTVVPWMFFVVWVALLAWTWSPAIGAAAAVGAVACAIAVSDEPRFGWQD